MAKYASFQVDSLLPLWVCSYTNLCLFFFPPAGQSHGLCSVSLFVCQKLSVCNRAKTSHPEFLKVYVDSIERFLLNSSDYGLYDLMFKIISGHNATIQTNFVY